MTMETPSEGAAHVYIHLKKNYYEQALAASASALTVTALHLSPSPPTKHLPEMPPHDQDSKKGCPALEYIEYHSVRPAAKKPPMKAAWWVVAKRGVGTQPVQRAMTNGERKSPGPDS